MTGPMRARRFAASLVSAASAVAGCANNATAALDSPTAAATVVTTMTRTSSNAAAATTLAVASGTTLAVTTPDRAPNGRAAPRAATSPAGLAAQIVGTERGLRDPATADSARPDLGHLNQLAYRTLSTKPEWDDAVLAAVPADLRPVVQTHLRARREFLEMRTTIGDTVPDWEIVEPRPVTALLGYYKEAEATTGIGWQYLAAINLVETGLGRINGLSTAGAIGPMQFLQSTWNEKGIGQGDIRDPHDAIQAAARYLVRRGGPADMAKALQGYNNHGNYVRAVSAYADLFKDDERSFHVVYQWEIYYLSQIGDLWLPVGYRRPTTLAVADYVTQAPWSAPAPGSYVPPAPKAN